MIRPSVPAPSDIPTDRPRIGVFDSGLGGLSVLRALRRLMPQARLTYVADSGFAPYGERDDAFIQTRSLAVSRWLIEIGVDGLVIACNTATAAAADLLRQTWPQTPIVGVEPGIKPAIRQSRTGRIGVLATEGTLRSARFQRLMQAQRTAEIELHLQPCPGLAAALESGDADSPAVRSIVDRCCEPLRRADVDTVVLGCTHYPFAAHHIQAALGEAVQLIDTSKAIARQTARQLGFEIDFEIESADDLQARASEGRIDLYTTGAPAPLQQAAIHWLALNQIDVKVIDP
jgi:glutamate racemase